MRTGTFEDTTAIVVGLNRLTGVRTLNHSNTWLWLLLSLFYKAMVMPCFFYAVYVDYCYDYSGITDMSVFMTFIAYMIMITVAFLSTIITQILGWKYYKEMSLLRKSIAETEQRLMNKNVVIDHRNLYVWIVGIFTVTALNGSLYCIFYVHAIFYIVADSEQKYIFSDMLLNIMIYIGGIVVLDFMLHVCWLGKSFKQTNDLLKKFFIDDHSIKMEDWDNKRDVSWLQRCFNESRIGHFFCPKKVTQFRRTRIMERQLCTLDKIDMLQQIRYIHLQLCSIMKLLNKIFDTQIMFHSIVTIQGFVLNLYIIYINFVTLDSSPSNSMHMVSFQVLNAFYVWLRVAVTCYLCEKTAKEAKQIVHIIYVCSIQNSDVELNNELVQFCLQVSLAEMDCKDVHLFWLNDGFILQSIGGIFTYFLIMIQWSVSLGVFGPRFNSTTFNQSY